MEKIGDTRKQYICHCLPEMDEHTDPHFSESLLPCTHVASFCPESFGKLRGRRRDGSQRRSELCVTIIDFKIIMNWRTVGYHSKSGKVIC